MSLGWVKLKVSRKCHKHKTAATQDKNTLNLKSHPLSLNPVDSGSLALESLTKQKGLPASREPPRQTILLWVTSRCQGFLLWGDSDCLSTVFLSCLFPATSSDHQISLMMGGPKVLLGEKLSVLSSCLHVDPGFSCWDNASESDLAHPKSWSPWICLHMLSLSNSVSLWGGTSYHSGETFLAVFRGPTWPLWSVSLDRNRLAASSLYSQTEQSLNPPDNTFVLWVGSKTRSSRVLTCPLIHQWMDEPPLLPGLSAHSGHECC